LRFWMSPLASPSRRMNFPSIVPNGCGVLDKIRLSLGKSLKRRVSPAAGPEVGTRVRYRRRREKKSNTSAFLPKGEGIINTGKWKMGHGLDKISVLLGNEEGKERVIIT